MHRPTAILAAALLALGFAPAAPAVADTPALPTAVIRWWMPPLTQDANADGVVDAYIGGNRTADVPADGRYDVVLDGCRSRNADSFEWTVAGATVRTDQCTTTVRLAEGTYRVKLKTRGEVGTAVARTRITVAVTIILGLGDSYSAGAGSAVPSDAPATYGYYDLNCARTPRSHQALAALGLEAADRHSSVILLHLSCAGAQITPGLLSPFRGNRPQVDDARDLLNGQAADLVLLSVGGNDTGFGTVVGLCLGTPGIDCPVTPVAGFPRAHDALMAMLAVLRDGTPADPLEGLPVLAGCLGSVGCTTSETPDGSGAALGLTPERIIYTTYPDLTKGDDGAYCAADPTSADPGLAFASAEEWRWIDRVYEALANEPTFTYTSAAGTSTVLDQSVPGLNAIVMETASRFGWTPVGQVYAGAARHGYCAGTPDPATGAGRWVNRIVEPTIPAPLLVTVHPNVLGQLHYSRSVAPVVAAALG